MFNSFSITILNNSASDDVGSTFKFRIVLYLFGLCLLHRLYDFLLGAVSLILLHLLKVLKNMYFDCLAFSNEKVLCFFFVKASSWVIANLR